MSVQIGRLQTILRYDVPASLVVFLIALPLSLGIAVASDAPVLAGLIAAVVGGVVAGAVGGSPLQVSGPAAGLTVVVAGLIAQFGWAVTCLITVLAGILQVLLGLSRVARAALAISPVVVHAMLAGIGITIVLQQAHVLLGGSSHSSAWQNIVELPEQLLAQHGAGLFFGLLVIGILIAWRWVPARVAMIPGQLVAILVATLLSIALPFAVSCIKIDGSLADAIQLPSLPDGNWAAVAASVLTVDLDARHREWQRDGQQRRNQGSATSCPGNHRDAAAAQSGCRSARAANSPAPCWASNCWGARRCSAMRSCGSSTQQHMCLLNTMVIPMPAGVARARRQERSPARLVPPGSTRAGLVGGHRTGYRPANWAMRPATTTVNPAAGPLT